MNIAWKTQKLVCFPRSLLAKHRRPYWLRCCFLVLSEAWMEGFKNASFCFWKHSCWKKHALLWYIKTKMSFTGLVSAQQQGYAFLWKKKKHTEYNSVTWIWTLSLLLNTNNLNPMKPTAIRDFEIPKLSLHICCCGGGRLLHITYTW